MRVNLLPYQETQKTGPRWAAVFSLLGVVLLISVTLVFYLALQGQVTSYEDRIARAKQDYAGYAAALQRKAYLDQLQAKHTQKSAFIGQLAGEGVKWNRVMDELRQIIPQTVVLDTMAATGENHINVKGRAGSLQSLVQFMVNIQKAVTVDRPDLHWANWEQPLNAFEFEMTCVVKEVDSDG